MLELGHSPSHSLLELQCPFQAVSAVVSVQCRGAVWVLGVDLTFHLRSLNKLGDPPAIDVLSEKQHCGPALLSGATIPP